MKLPGAILVLGLAISGPSAGFAETPQAPLTFEGMLKYDQATLDRIYRESSAGELPKGVVRGKAVVVPGAKVSPAQMKFFSFWQGKVFSEDDKTLRNRIIGHDTFQGETYIGNSWLDGKPTWYIDYRKLSPIIYIIHDEFRQVAPNLWLGRTWLRGEHPPLVLNFVIEKDPTEKASQTAAALLRGKLE